MSPMRVATLVVATTASALSAIAVIAAVAADRYHVVFLGGSLMMLVTAAATWVGFLVAGCRDQVIRRLDEVESAVADFGDRRETDGRLAGARSRALPRPASEGPHLRAVDQT